MSLDSMAEADGIVWQKERQGNCTPVTEIQLNVTIFNIYSALEMPWNAKNKSPFERDRE